MCGIATIISGALSGPPILISPESAAGVKAGAKTGLSTVICGICFCLATFFAPLFKEVPEAATAPLLIMVGVLLFQNCTKVDWKRISESVPAYCVLFFIPFTYSILTGVCIGYVMYGVIKLLTGEFYEEVLKKYYDVNDLSKLNDEELNISNRSTSVSVSRVWQMASDFFSEASANALKLNMGYHQTNYKHNPDGDGSEKAYETDSERKISKSSVASSNF
jgi:MFS superfamily sulfate permease-like transporter